MFREKEDLRNWKGCPPPRKEVIHGKYVRLEPLDPEKHGDGLYEITTEEGAEERIKYLWDELPKSRQEYQKFLEELADRKDRIIFVIIFNATGKPCGRTGYQNILPEHGRIEIGPIYHARNLISSVAAGEAFFITVKPLFEMGYRRCELKIWDKNQRSIAALGKIGLQYEGTFRKYFVMKGQNRDDAWFSLTDDIYPLFEAVLDIYTSPDNVDERGFGRRHLSDIREELLKKDEFQYIFINPYVKPRQWGVE